MDSSEVVPTEDAIQALIDHLVYPLLPSKIHSHEPPTLAKQQAVAKQMHAVVLLYNYYHRKQFPQLEFLDFESFCKMAVIAKHSLLMHMKQMKECNEKLGELDTQFSLTEQMVMDACNICIGLDPSKDTPNTEKWPVSKVAVFVVDSKKENCLLQYCSVTLGVWSAIEKIFDIPFYKSGCALEMKCSIKKEKSAKVPLWDDFLRQLAFSAVKETTGIDQADLTVLESYRVYSISKVKSTCQFYLMQCNGAISEELTQVPLEHVISSLQGPVAAKGLGGFVATSVVEYFPLLPYTKILFDWLQRETTTIGSQFSQVLLEEPRKLAGTCSSKSEQLAVEFEGDQIGYGTYKAAELELTGENGVNSTRTEISVEEGRDPCVMEMDFPDEELKSMKSKIPDTALVEKKDSFILANSKGMENGFKDKTGITDSPTKPCDLEISQVKFSSVYDAFESGFDEMTSADLPLVTFCPSIQNIDNRSCPQNMDDKSSSQNLDKLQVMLASNRNETLFRALKEKRKELSQLQRQLEDAVAKCEKNLHLITSGGEDDLKLQIEPIIVSCNVACSNGVLQPGVGIHIRSHEQHSAPLTKRKKLSEAVLTFRSPCQELDDICSDSNWIFPKYRVFPSDSGFVADVIVQGLDFESSASGELQSSPQEARASAATQILSKLRRMASQASELLSSA